MEDAVVDKSEITVEEFQSVCELQLNSSLNHTIEINKALDVLDPGNAVLLTEFHIYIPGVLYLKIFTC